MGHSTWEVSVRLDPLYAGGRLMLLVGTGTSALGTNEMERNATLTLLEDGNRIFFITT